MISLADEIAHINSRFALVRHGRPALPLGEYGPWQHFAIGKQHESQDIAIALLIGLIEGAVLTTKLFEEPPDRAIFWITEPELSEDGGMWKVYARFVVVLLADLPEEIAA